QPRGCTSGSRLRPWAKPARSSRPVFAGTHALIVGFSRAATLSGEPPVVSAAPRLYRALHPIGVHRAIYWGGMQPFGVRYTSPDPHEHPVVLPHVSHFMQVPFRTSVKLPHSEHISPS